MNASAHHRPASVWFAGPRISPSASWKPADWSTSTSANSSGNRRSERKEDKKGRRYICYTTENDASMLF